MIKPIDPRQRSQAAGTAVQRQIVMTCVGIQHALQADEDIAQLRLGRTQPYDAVAIHDPIGLLDRNPIAAAGRQQKRSVSQANASAFQRGRN